MGKVLVEIEMPETHEIELVAIANKEFYGHTQNANFRILPPTQPAAVEPMAMQTLHDAYGLGFLRAAEWAKRDDLLSDVNSLAYLSAMVKDLTALAAADAPDGHQLVPVKPTKEMLLAGATAFRSHALRFLDDYQEICTMLDAATQAHDK